MPTPDLPATAPDSVDAFRQRLAFVRQQIDQACHRAGRPPASVRLLPVSKTVDVDRLRLACDAGCTVLGENKVQEAYAKWQALADRPELQWSVIGHLQTNKAKYIARFATEFQALDSLRVAEALDRRLQIEGRRLTVLVQINTSGEASKFGLPPDAAAGFLQQLKPFSALQVRGLMTLARFDPDLAVVRPCFQRLRLLRDQLQSDAPQGMSLQELSMGMSGDFACAIEEGATLVRIGQAIFGARALPDSHYWPGLAGT